MPIRSSAEILRTQGTPNTEAARRDFVVATNFNVAQLIRAEGVRYNTEFQVGIRFAAAKGRMMTAAWSKQKTRACTA
jgi:hypothetical protein